MIKAEILMKQAGDTAEVWLRQAQESVSNLKMSDDAKSRIIAAFMQAAAQDQHTMTIRALAEQGLLKSHE